MSSRIVDVAPARLQLTPRRLLCDEAAERASSLSTQPSVNECGAGDRTFREQWRVKSWTFMSGKIVFASILCVTRMACRSGEPRQSGGKTRTGRRCRRRSEYALRAQVDAPCSSRRSVLKSALRAQVGAPCSSRRSCASRAASAPLARQRAAARYIYYGDYILEMVDL